MWQFFLPQQNMSSRSFSEHGHFRHFPMQIEYDAASIMEESFEQKPEPLEVVALEQKHHKSCLHFVDVEHASINGNAEADDLDASPTGELGWRHPVSDAPFWMRFYWMIISAFWFIIGHFRAFVRQLMTRQCFARSAVRSVLTLRRSRQQRRSNAMCVSQHSSTSVTMTTSVGTESEMPFLRTALTADPNYELIEHGTESLDRRVLHQYYSGHNSNRMPPVSGSPSLAIVETPSTQHRIATFLSRQFLWKGLKRTKSVSKLERHRRGLSPLTPEDGPISHFVPDPDSTPSSSNGFDPYFHHRDSGIASFVSPSGPFSTGTIRSCRSHESLSTYAANTHMLDLSGSSLGATGGSSRHLHPTDTSTPHSQKSTQRVGDVEIRALHDSVLGTPNVFQLTTRAGTHKYYACRTQAERDRWFECIRQTMNPQLNCTRRQENSLQIWILEAKGIASKRRYFCELCIDDTLFARTVCKMKEDLCFWGEMFEFSDLSAVERIQIYVYREADRKKKKDRNTLIGLVQIAVSNLNKKQPVEQWYTLSSGSGEKPLKGTLPSIRIKAKYQSLHILPMSCYSSMIQYLQQNYLILCNSLESVLTVRTKEDFASSLVRIMHHDEMSKVFLCDLILQEITNLENEHLMFRGNSLATKAMEAFMKLVGEQYLKDTLGDFVQTLVQAGEDFEVDPVKVHNATQLDKNEKNLRYYVDLAWHKIINSVHYFPPDLREVFCSLRERLARTGRGDLADYLISSSIFLRFLCPAILSPSLFNLITEYPSEKASRGLTLVAKTIQTLANFSQFGGKERYMERMNGFVQKNQDNIRQFLLRISSPIYKASTPFEPQAPVNIGKEMCLLHALLREGLPLLKSESQGKPFADLRQIVSTVTESLNYPSKAFSDVNGHPQRGLRSKKNMNGNNSSGLSAMVTSPLSDYDNNEEVMLISTPVPQDNRRQSELVLRRDLPITPKYSLQDTHTPNSDMHKFNQIMNDNTVNNNHQEAVGFNRSPAAKSLHTADDYVSYSALEENLGLTKQGLIVQQQRQKSHGLHSSYHRDLLAAECAPRSLIDHNDPNLSARHALLHASSIEQISYADDAHSTSTLSSRGSHEGGSAGARSIQSPANSPYLPGRHSVTNGSVDSGKPRSPLLPMMAEQDELNCETTHLRPLLEKSTLEKRPSDDGSHPSSGYHTMPGSSGPASSEGSPNNDLLPCQVKPVCTNPLAFANPMYSLQMIPPRSQSNLSVGTTVVSPSASMDASMYSTTSQTSYSGGDRNGVFVTPESATPIRQSRMTNSTPALEAGLPMVSHRSAYRVSTCGVQNPKQPSAAPSRSRLKSADALATTLGTVGVSVPHTESNGSVPRRMPRTNPHLRSPRPSLGIAGMYGGSTARNIDSAPAPPPLMLRRTQTDSEINLRSPPDDRQALLQRSLKTNGLKNYHESQMPSRYLRDVEEQPDDGYFAELEEMRVQLQKAQAKLNEASMRDDLYKHRKTHSNQKSKQTICNDQSDQLRVYKTPLSRSQAVVAPKSSEASHELIAAQRKRIESLETANEKLMSMIQQHQVSGAGAVVTSSNVTRSAYQSPSDPIHTRSKSSLNFYLDQTEKRKLVEVSHLAQESCSSPMEPEKSLLTPKQTSTSRCKSLQSVDSSFEPGSDMGDSLPRSSGSEGGSELSSDHASSSLPRNDSYSSLESPVNTCSAQVNKHACNVNFQSLRATDI